MKRSGKWAVVRKEAPKMPWDPGEGMNPILADAYRRIVPLRGSAYCLRFWVECSDLFDRINEAILEVVPRELGDDEREQIIRQFYHETVEFRGRADAQEFLRTWLGISNYVVSFRKGAIAMAALKKQTRRLVLR